MTNEPANAPAIHPSHDLSRASLPIRTRLPETRESVTHKFNIQGHEGYITVGLYEDGRPGELFIKMAKQGSTMSGLMDTIGILTSLALQHGVPIEALVRKLEHQKFEPAGWTPNNDIGEASSVVDYIFRWFGINFVPEYRAAANRNRVESHEGSGLQEPVE